MKDKINEEQVLEIDKKFQLDLLNSLIYLSCLLLLLSAHGVKNS